MFYYSQFKANKNTHKQHVKDTTPTIKHTRRAPAKVAYQVRTGPMTRVTQEERDTQMFSHDAFSYSSVTTEEGVLEVYAR
jgi:hypothetical protein